MANLDALAPNYRRAQQRWPGAPMLVQSYDALAACFSGSAHGLIEHVKSFIESVCRTVLGERKVSYAAADDLPKLFKSASQNLPYLPSTASDAADARKSLRKTLNGLGTTIQGICELRNQCGFASHGSESSRPTMEGVQALLAAGAADAIVGFLHRVHHQDRTPRLVVFDDNVAFNEHLDETFGPFRIFEAEFRPSEVLFTLEQETYRIYLAEFDSGIDSEGRASADGDVQP